MRSLKLSSLFRRNAAAELRDRAADLQADLARVARPAVVEAPETPAPIRASSDDTELLSLGRRFEEARAHEVAACEACNAASKQSGAGEAPLELEAAAADAGDIAAALAYQLADIPAHSADGLRLKIRALAHYNPSFFRLGLPDNPDPDQVLARSLLLDARGEAPPFKPTDWQNPPAGFMAYPADDPQGFVIVREGLRLELERLHRIASAEYARKVEPGATEATRAHVRQELRLWLFEAIPPSDNTAQGPAGSRLSPTRRWAIGQAATVNLSGLEILELHNLYNLFASASDAWNAAACLPWADESLNAGEVVEREDERAAEIRDRIVAEIRTKVPTGSLEHGWRLETLIRHALLCEGSLQHAPDLRAEIAKAWGG